ncbi:RNA-binding S4 domain-containing protein [Vibrio aquaticus]|uniref:RNA-binding S4 domain-containing protein n=1 Tax=Vibrio aquaticus TaxID=2496559 RepID=A0A3S0V462_9VIBR|nr:RNA-binding S4 domain-containing protein [Vibrio aquaticus]RTZ17248.1 RNA-binding S4 domain-containing protein [Vibrio aquaticus]
MSQDYEQGEEIEIEAIGIEVSSQPIELYKVFKIANLVGGGGEAKHIIAEGYVAVNGELETRKRRKMYDGDFFEFNQEYYVVVCDAPVTEQEETKPSEKKVTAPKASRNESKKNAGNNKNKQKNSKAGKSAKKSSSAKTSNPGKKSKPTQDTKKSDKPKNSNGRGSIDFF